ncbi:FAD-binding domain-containing protein [Patulibacter minatonensis]|uniref:FAD-binding domain-containing protein n=1 Tax=Patulibacter minatonensis TaxID=298163 RepID=UPI00047AFCCA|nr:FAD-binding domain-containing protein [Patulibacter minatonensis]
MSRLPAIPPRDPAAAERWVAEHLGHLALEGAEGIRRSPAFRGGQSAADAAIEELDVRGYAGTRNEVWPVDRRGATRLSPYIRHGLLTLQDVWGRAEAAPARDRGKFRDELLWQEYARHVYARLGTASAVPLRHEAPPVPSTDGDPWPREMACVDLCRVELRRDGWLVNQTRMWMASQWALRSGAPWQDGEDAFFRHLLDGSRAANRLGWQWTVGTATGRPYGFSRWQVEKRAPGLCASCALRDRCPVERFPDLPKGADVAPPEVLRRDPDPAATGGPELVVREGEPDAVWLTAESLGSSDPALAARPELPVVFVLDEDRLRGWRLSGKRLVFLAETLAEIGEHRELEVHLGSPRRVLAGRRLAATWTPVPGWRRLADRLSVVEAHPWPWLTRPHGRSARSFSAWRKALPADRARGA